MVKKIVLFILIICFAACLFAGCGEEEEEEPYEEIPTLNDLEEPGMRNTVIYLEDNNGYMVPVMKKIKWVEGIGKAAVSELKQTQLNEAEISSAGLNGVLPEDAEFSLAIEDGLGMINMQQKDLEAQSALQESNKIVAVVNTLTEFPTIDRVQILIDGKKHGVLPNGTDLSEPFEPFDLNVESAEEELDIKSAQKLILYFENDMGTLTVPVTRYISGEKNVYSAISELLRGPKQNNGLKSIFPEGTKILDIQLTDENELVLNLSKEMDAIRDTHAEKVVMKTLVLTLGQFDNVDNVRILIEGEDYLDSAEPMMAVSQYINIY